jgi:glycerol-3-phosphate dehydrogenase
MQRDLGAFDRQFDVLIIGGGVYGACLARIAAIRGCSVALLERDDFGGAVSHNSLKTVHGGFRYIQHFDLPRIWESVAAQRSWLRAAPHLVRPLRFVIPAYGYGTRGPVVFAGGVCAFQAVSFHRNIGLSATSRLPMPGLISRRALVSQYPELARRDLTGGAYWYDAQMLDANRLVLECLQDACAHGAVVANHAEVLHLRSAASVVDGAVARDRISGREFEVRARVTVNATGPYVESILKAGPRPMKIKRPLVWTRNVNIVTRKLFDTHDAVGVGSQRSSDAAIGKSKRLFFVSPWQDCSIVGTSHTQHLGAQHDIQAEVATDVVDFLSEVNEALPNARLRPEDVRYVHSGLTPAEDDVARAKRGTVIDHGIADNVQCLITVLGIKYTTAPTVAASAMPIIERLLGKQGPAQDESFSRPLPGSLGYSVASSTPPTDDVSWAQRIYGGYSRSLMAISSADGLTPDEHVFRCRVIFGIENEMVVRLRDAIFRATDRAERGNLTATQLEWCAGEMARRLGWTEKQRLLELNDVATRLHHRPRSANGLNAQV